MPSLKAFYVPYFVFLFFGPIVIGQTTIQVLMEETHQTIDGFGAFQAPQDGIDYPNEAWFQDLFFEDMACSIYRVDLTPQLVSPYSDFSVYSPWFMGSATDHPLNLEDPDNPDGPEGNRVRTYTSAADYSRDFGGYNAPIAVMGPNIEQNIEYFTYSPNGIIREGIERKEELGDFKLIGSIWSPLPWVKISSGNTYPANWWPGPVLDTPWPFIWGGNYAGGRLDVSNTPIPEFDDSDLGGTGPTSALTQFARSTAAYVKGFQDHHEVEFYAISIQNELNFEQFYNSATYPLSSQYIAAVKAVRAEFDQYSDLQNIQIMGPEDLLGGGIYGLWEFGGGSPGVIHKNLQYLQNIANDPEAEDAIDFFCIHGYDTDGASAADANPIFWENWKDGWGASPAPGIPGNIQGYADYNKKSWMTETSGEFSEWLYPNSGFPGQGAWSVALRIHQALAVGNQSAWVYWTMMDTDEQGNVINEALSSETLRAQAPKYVAAKHFFKFVRPNAKRLTCNSTSGTIHASAYKHDSDSTLTIVLINANPNPQSVNLQIPALVGSELQFDSYASENNSLWQNSTPTINNGTASLNMAAYSVLTLTGSFDTSTSTENINSIATIEAIRLFPNPVEENTNLVFELIQKEEISIKLLDINGKVLKILFEGQKPAGIHQLNIDMSDLPSGVYNLQMQSNTRKTLQKVVKNVR